MISMSEEKLFPKLRFKGFDEEWKSYKIGDISKTYSGGTPSTSIKEYYEGDIPFIKSGEINNDITEQYITEDAINNSSAKRVQKGDLLLALYGATSGEVAISKINGAINQAVLKIDNDMDNYFQYNYFLKYKEQITHKYLQGGQGNLSANIIKKLEFKFPELSEQQKISKFLLLIDKKIQFLEKKHTAYQDFKKYLMQQIFAQKLRFADCNDEWNLFKLGDIVELMRNGSSENQVSFKTEFPVTRIETISKGILNFDKVGYVEKIDSSYLLQYGDILLSNINSLKYIGNCVFFDEDKTLYHGMNLMLMRFKDRFNKKYLFYYMKFYQQWFQKMACQAVNQASINLSSLKKFPFYIPPTIDEQNKIVSVIDNTEHKINSIEEQILKMKDFKKGLLQQMFV